MGKYNFENIPQEVKENEDENEISVKKLQEALDISIVDENDNEIEFDTRELYKDDKSGSTFDRTDWSLDIRKKIEGLSHEEVEALNKKHAEEIKTLKDMIGKEIESTKSEK